MQPIVRWRLVSLINVFGPLAYFRWGRVHRPVERVTNGSRAWLQSGVRWN